MKVEKSKKSSKGITLIALVITIIVLLILAAVSIATLTGENGILTRAGDAKTNTEIAEEKEAIGLAYNGVMAENRGNGVSAGELQAELISNGYDVTANGSNPITVKFNDSQRVYTVDSNGNIEISDGNEDNDGTTLVEMFIAGESCENPDNCDNEEHLHVGDYLKYTPANPTASTANIEDNPLDAQYTGYSGEEQKYTVNSSTKWQVIGLSEDRQHVLLTTESPIQRDGADPYLKLGGAESYIYCKKVLDGVCSIYANDDLAYEVRSMTMEDITNVLGITINKEENKAYNKNGTEISGFQGFFGAENQYIYNSTDYAPENYVIDKYRDGSYTRKTAGSVANILSATSGTVDQSAYIIMATDPNVVEQGSRIYNILFNGTTAQPYSKSYWLASPGVGVNSDFGHAAFGPGGVNGGFATAGGSTLFISAGYRSALSFAVRPVISLKSEIKGSEIERDVASTSDIWDGKAPDLEGESLGRADAGQVTTE